MSLEIGRLVIRKLTIEEAAESFTPGPKPGPDASELDKVNWRYARALQKLKKISAKLGANHILTRDAWKETVYLRRLIRMETVKIAESSDTIV